MSNHKNHAPTFGGLGSPLQEKTIDELSSEFGVHQPQIHRWVKQLKESAVDVFYGEVKNENVKKIA